MKILLLQYVYYKSTVDDNLLGTPGCMNSAWEKLIRIIIIIITDTIRQNIVHHYYCCREEVWRLPNSLHLTHYLIKRNRHLLKWIRSNIILLLFFMIVLIILSTIWVNLAVSLHVLQLATNRSLYLEIFDFFLIKCIPISYYGSRTLRVVYAWYFLFCDTP